MTTFPRPGFVRITRLGSTPAPLRKKGCGSGKTRYDSEAEALDALIRVRDARGESPERPPEKRIYPCDSCLGFHLTSADLRINDLLAVRERGDGEPWDSYARRLEKKIAAQRAEIVSLLALGNGSSNRELRKRVPALLNALGRVTERWQSERRNRENLVELLRQKHPLCWLLWRVTLGRDR